MGTLKHEIREHPILAGIFFLVLGPYILAAVLAIVLLYAAVSLLAFAFSR